MARQNWIADMKCEVGNCSYVDQHRVISQRTRREALDAVMDCPVCDTKESLHVIANTLRVDA